MSKAIEQPDRRTMIHAGPWKQREDVYGQSCQLCKLPIFARRDSYVRIGDDLSPALYRHKQCHEDSVAFTADVKEPVRSEPDSAQGQLTTSDGRK